MSITSTSRTTCVASSSTPSPCLIATRFFLLKRFEDHSGQKVGWREIRCPSEIVRDPCGWNRWPDLLSPFDDFPGLAGVIPAQGVDFCSEDSAHEGVEKHL